MLHRQHCRYSETPNVPRYHNNFGCACRHTMLHTFEKNNQTTNGKLSIKRKKHQTASNAKRKKNKQKIEQQICGRVGKRKSERANDERK